MGTDRKTEIRNEIKSYMVKHGWTLADVVRQMNQTRPPEERTTAQNLTNKLARGTIRYGEVLEIAEIIGYRIKWEEKER